MAESVRARVLSEHHEISRWVARGYHEPELLTHLERALEHVDDAAMLQSLWDAGVTPEYLLLLADDQWGILPTPVLLALRTDQTVLPPELRSVHYAAIRAHVAAWLDVEARDA